MYTGGETVTSRDGASLSWDIAVFLYAETDHLDMGGEAHVAKLPLGVWSLHDFIRPLRRLFPHNETHMQHVVLQLESCWLDLQEESRIAPSTVQTQVS